MLHTMLRDLVARGHEAIVLLADQDLAPYELDGVLVLRKKHRYLEKLARASDVLITHLDRTQEAVQAAKDTERPLVHVVHNDRQLAYHYVKADDATLIIPNSEWLAAALDWPGEQLVVRPPVTVADYELERDPFTARYITLINVTLEKGSTRFYDLARAMPDRDFLAVAGAYGIQDIKRTPSNVTVLANTPAIRDDVYARTRVILMPSSLETWGRVAVEAACSGIPTIAHPTDGLTEALGYAGLFADRADGRQWEAIIRALDHEPFYRQASDDARRRALELEQLTDADLEAFAGRLEELVRSHPARRPYDASMILDSARAGIRCPLCGSSSCGCKPTADDVYSRLQADSTDVDVIERTKIDRGELRVYRTSLGDFKLDEVDARREGLLVAGDKPVRSVLQRLAPVMERADLEALTERYEDAAPESRQAFLDDLALTDRWKVGERLEELLGNLVPAGIPATGASGEPGAQGSDGPGMGPGAAGISATYPEAGRVGDVLEWVGEDHERAVLALELERAAKNRTTLVAELERRAR